MCKRKRASPRDLDKSSPEKKAFFEKALREMQELAEEAEDWRVHMPYEALVSYRMDSALHEQCENHYTNCPFCQKAVDALNPYD